MGKKWKKRTKNDKDDQDVNKAKKEKRNKIDKKVKKENTEKEEEIKEEEDDKKEKLLEKIYKVKYVSVYVGNENDDEGVETYRENGEKVGLYDEEDPPLFYSDFYFKVDVDTGRILDWPDTKLYVKVNIRVQDTGFYDFYDKHNNKIYEDSGYVPDFLDISCKGYGDDICFNTDINGYILDWKEKKIKKKIIKYLKDRLLGDDIFAFN